MPRNVSDQASQQKMVLASDCCDSYDLHMIYDSVPWKEELLRSANKLERVQGKKKWSEHTAFVIEREIMIGAFIIRRLNEAKKLSDGIVRAPVSVKRHELFASPPDIWNSVEPWKQFDLETSITEKITLSKMCNQIIHSWSWLVHGDDRIVDGIYVTSDRDRSRCLYYIEIETLIEVFRSVGKESIVSMKMKTNSHGERIFYDLRSDIDFKTLDQEPWT